MIRICSCVALLGLGGCSVGGAVVGAGAAVVGVGAAVVGTAAAVVTKTPDGLTEEAGTPPAR